MARSNSGLEFYPTSFGMTLSRPFVLCVAYPYIPTSMCVCISGVEQKASIINAKHSLRMELSVALWNKNRLFVFNKAQGRNAHLAYL